MWMAVLRVKSQNAAAEGPVMKRVVERAGSGVERVFAIG